MDGLLVTASSHGQAIVLLSFFVLFYPTLRPSATKMKVHHNIASVTLALSPIAIASAPTSAPPIIAGQSMSTAIAHLRRQPARRLDVYNQAEAVLVPMMFPTHAKH